MDLSRVEMVIGPEAVQKLNDATVAVIGLGGVGSYVAEALCRSGIGSFIIMDNDTVEPSNINRQLPALTSTIGRFKADIMAARMRDINPLCRIKVVKEFYKPGSFEQLFLNDEPDFIADAIDSTESTELTICQDFTGAVGMSHVSERTVDFNVSRCEIRFYPRLLGAVESLVEMISVTKSSRIGRV